MRKDTVQRLALGASLCALAMATPAHADETAPTTADLAALVRAQASEIADLKRRLAAVEAHDQQAAAAPAQAPTPAAADAQVAAATQSSTSGELAAMQTQIAQLTEQSKHDVKVDWKTGAPTFESADGFFTFHPEGRIVADVSSTGGSRYATRDISGTEFRDLRLGAEGTIGKLGYNLEVDFAGNAVSVKEAYIYYKTKLFGMGSKTYIGNSLNDRTIEGDTELVYLPFAERNAVASVTAPSIGYFGLGAQEVLSGKGWHASVAIKGDDISGNTGTTSDDIAYLGRFHVNPILNANSFIHLGGWAYHEKLETPTAINTTSAVASDYNAEVRVSASSIAGVTSDNGYGAELGAGWHSLWAFAEYGQRNLRVPTNTYDIEQKAWSVYGGWFITGEKPGYDAVTGSFTKPEVLHPVTGGGAGAFELLARYDEYDFKSAPRGGVGSATTLAGNWYVNDLFDFKLNYILWRTDNVVGSFPGRDSGHTVLVRGEIAF